MVNVQKISGNDKYRWAHRWVVDLKHYPVAFILMAVIVYQLSTVCRLSYAQGSSIELHIREDDRSLQIVAEGADIKNVLSELAIAANIAITYPVSLEKRITMDKRGLSVSGALKVLLKGINHVILYSGPTSKKAKVEKVLVLRKKTKRQPISRRKERVLNRRIKAYQRQIDSLKRRLASLDANSQQGKRYLNRINRLENNVERLQRQVY